MFFHYFSDAYKVVTNERLKIDFVESVGAYTRYLPEFLTKKKLSIEKLDSDGKPFL
jgi:hypothetical protein